QFRSRNNARNISALSAVLRLPGDTPESGIVYQRHNRTYPRDLSPQMSGRGWHKKPGPAGIFGVRRAICPETIPRPSCQRSRRNGKLPELPFQAPVTARKRGLNKAGGCIVPADRDFAAFYRFAQQFLFAVKLFFCILRRELKRCEGFWDKTG